MEYSYNYSYSPDVASSAGTAVFGVLMLFFLVFGLIMYIYFSLSLMKIAQKLNVENAWLAWIPLLNLIVFFQAAGKPVWWILLMFVPFVNLIIMIISWMAIAKNLGKPEWLGILMIVPIANIILPGYLAFSKK